MLKDLIKRAKSEDKKGDFKPERNGTNTEGGTKFGTVKRGRAKDYHSSFGDSDVEFKKLGRLHDDLARLRLYGQIKPIDSPFGEVICVKGEFQEKDCYFAVKRSVLNVTFRLDKH